MKSIYLKEISAFLSSLVGYVVLLVFLIAAGIFLWVLPDTNIMDYGYASLEQFFTIAPWLLLFLIPAVTMRSFADEYRGGTMEWLQTKPLTALQITSGKFLACVTLVFIALLPTLIYIYSVNYLAIADASLDYGSILGSYIGLVFLVMAFTAVGIFCSSLSDNQIVGFLIAVILCYLLYSGFEALSRIPSFAGVADYYLGLLGMDYHYNQINRGVLDSRDLIYFLSVVFLFTGLTLFTLQKRRLQ